MKERVAAADGFDKGKAAASGGKGKGRVVRSEAGAARYGVAVGDVYTKEKGGVDDDLERGVQGERTRGAQDALVRAGFLDEASGAGKGRDGKFGPKTEAAVRAFQKAQGMAVTGKLDAATNRALARVAPDGDPAGGKLPAGTKKKLAALSPAERDAVIKRAKEIAASKGGGAKPKPRAGAKRVEEDQVPMRSSGGAKLLDYDGAGTGVARYADGSVFDGAGWQPKS